MLLSVLYMYMQTTRVYRDNSSPMILKFEGRRHLDPFEVNASFGASRCPHFTFKADDAMQFQLTKSHRMLDRAAMMFTVESISAKVHRRSGVGQPEKIRTLKFYCGQEFGMQWWIRVWCVVF